MVVCVREREYVEERKRERESVRAGRIMDASSNTTVCAIVCKCLKEQERMRAGRSIHVFSDGTVCVC